LPLANRETTGQRAADSLAAKSWPNSGRSGQPVDFRRFKHLKCWSNPDRLDDVTHVASCCARVARWAAEHV